MLLGPLAIATTPENISIASGYYKLNPLLLASIGSQAALPVPMLVPGLPALLGFASKMNDLVKQQIDFDEGIA